MSFPYTTVHYKPVSKPFCSRGREEENPLVEVTVNSKEEYSICPKYVQEFSLGTALYTIRYKDLTTWFAYLVDGCKVLFYNTF
jgi:hypothetical protein